MSDEEACARLYRDLWNASIAKDAAGMAAALADDYVLVGFLVEPVVSWYICADGLQGEPERITWIQS